MRLVFIFNKLNLHFLSALHLLRFHAISKSHTKLQSRNKIFIVLL